MRIGLDFGTTHSGAAVCDGPALSGAASVHTFALDAHSPDPAVIPSALYITRAHEVLIGQEAIDAYYRDHTGRPSRLSREYVGQVETILSDVGSVKGYPVGPQSMVQDVYVLVDRLSPGRLLRSLKSALASNYEGTTVFGRYYTLEDLLALYLGEIRRRVEAEAGEGVEGVVLGRPVHFEGREEGGDRRAVARLQQAAERAGLGQVTFELEPVAAALYYELSAEAPQDVLVFDLGGGTLDVTVMRVGGPSERAIYAVGGAGIAGDAFDRRLMEEVVLDHLGRGSTWGPDGAPFPGRYTDALLYWQSLPELQRPETLRFLHQAQETSSDPRALRALESLILHNDTPRLFGQVEAVKIALSSERFATIQLSGEGYALWQPVTRTQFESFIAAARAEIEACVLDTLARSGLRADQIVAVVRTGGSAQIPCFVEMLGRLFGEEKVVLSNVFSSVTAGLAVRAAAGA